MSADCCTTIDPSCEDDEDEALLLMEEDAELLVQWLTSAMGKLVAVAAMRL